MVRWYALVDHEVVGPFDHDEWYAAHGGPDWRYAQMRDNGVDPWRVGYTELGDGRDVSTVFLGLDHNYFGEGPPLVFESMVFPECGELERYSTWAEAEAGHAAMVEAALARGRVELEGP